MNPIQVLASDLGSFLHVLSLNPAFRLEARRLRLTLEINCELVQAGRTLLDLDEQLLSACPSLRLHQCRGPHEYRLFESQADDFAAPPIEANLALAHLIEHVMIDTVAFVTEAESVSGVTGAYTNSSSRFDVFVECPDESVGALATYVGITWIASLLRGARVNGAARSALGLARYLYQERPRAVDTRRAARELNREPSEIEQDFGWLMASGYAREVPQSMNFSGLPAYQLYHVTA